MAWGSLCSPGWPQTHRNPPQAFVLSCQSFVYSEEEGGEEDRQGMGLAPEPQQVIGSFPQGKS